MQNCFSPGSRGTGAIAATGSVRQWRRAKYTEVSTYGDVRVVHNISASEAICLICEDVFLDLPSVETGQLMSVSVCASELTVVSQIALVILEL